MNKILKIKAREIIDSRGNPTIECEVFFELKDENGKSKIKNVFSSVPSGASIGRFEAMELRDNDKNRFNGKGVLQAIKNIEEKIFPKIVGMNVIEQEKIDQKMIKLDGTKNKANLGANAILAVSMAVCRAGAIVKKVELYEYINDLTTKKSDFTTNEQKTRLHDDVERTRFNLNKDKIEPRYEIPRAFFNVINGGNHASNKIATQEFMISPNLESFAKNYQAAAEIYQVLKKELNKEFGGEATLLGDEGGFAPNFQTDTEVLEFLSKVIKKSGYENKVDFTLDIAASEFYSPEKDLYNVDYKKKKSELKTAKELLKIYLNLSKKFPIISLEDPFDQADFLSFAKLKKEIKNNFLQVKIVGDDLTVSNSERIQVAINKNSCDTLLLKINQIGSITEAINSAILAQKNNWKIMVSHRSGETTDDFIADFAVGIQAEEIKAGATARGERVCKYNRLLKIDDELQKNKK